MHSLSSSEFLAFDWQKLALDPVFLYLVGWFASGLLLGRLPSEWRLTGFLLVGIALQGILRGASLPGFELMSFLVYGYACLIQRTFKRNSSIDGESEQAASRSRRWVLSCWGMAAVVIIAFVLRDFLTDQHASVELGSQNWPLLVLDFFQLMRLVSFLHEYGSGVEELPSAKHFLLWANLPPHALIVRLSELMPQLQQMSNTPTWAEIFGTRQMTLLGLGLGKWAIGIALGSVSECWFTPELSWAYKWGRTFFLGPWSFYLTLAGLVDIQSFIARTWNLQLPMAWNWPFFRTSISTFWANFNMTLTSFYRDYLFFSRWGLTQPNLYLNAMIVFIAMGIWHALNWYWFLFGVYHGIGFCVFLGFQQLRKKYVFGKWYSTWPVMFVCWIITYVFVCLSWLIPNKILAVLGTS